MRSKLLEVYSRSHILLILSYEKRPSNFESGISAATWRFRLSFLIEYFYRAENASKPNWPPMLGKMHKNSGVIHVSEENKNKPFVDKGKRKLFCSTCHECLMGWNNY